ncbi:MAG: Two component regulator propeller [bacterium ADurb.Bin374]|nr:MAG: Two component regulator propeller [bacterium ADurb.Bin374]
MAGNKRCMLIFVVLGLLGLFFFPDTGYAATNWMKYFRKDTLLNTYMRAYAVQGDRLWVGTWGDGIVVYDGAGTKNYNSKSTRSTPELNDGLLSDCVTTLTVDERAGRVWIGTNEGLASCNLECGDWKRYTSKDGLPNDVIRDVAVDAKGVVWVGTPSGVASFDGESWKKHDSTSGLHEDSIHSMTVTGDTVWVATVGGSVCRFRDGEWKVFMHN